MKSDIIETLIKPTRRTRSAPSTPRALGSVTSRKKQAQRAPRGLSSSPQATVFLVDPDGKLKSRFPADLPGIQLLTSRSEVIEALTNSLRDTIWVAGNPAVFLSISRSLSLKGAPRLLLLNCIDDVRIQALRALFRHVAGGSDTVHFLDTAILAEVLTDPHRNDLFIGGAIDLPDKSVLLIRGSLEPMVVPLAWFRSQRGKQASAVASFQVTDYGQTVRIGTFEAAADAILYEFDPDYRTRSRKNQLASDTTFGGSLRRLRLQKGLTRADFPGITEKTIQRIENNQITRPREATLDVLARTLGVSVEELGTY